MRRFSLIAAAMFGLLGCVSAPPPAVYGYFLAGGTPAITQSLAGDAARKLTALHPPAHTRLQLLHPMQDDFGTALTTALRSAGYAIVEPLASAVVNTPGSPAVETAGQPAVTTIAYIVDQQPELGLWRLTLLVNGQPLSRLYRTSAGAMTPASHWIRKE